MLIDASFSLVWLVEATLKVKELNDYANLNYHLRHEMENPDVGIKIYSHQRHLKRKNNAFLIHPLKEIITFFKSIFQCLSQVSPSCLDPSLFFF